MCKDISLALLPCFTGSLSTCSVHFLLRDDVPVHSRCAGAGGGVGGGVRCARGAGARGQLVHTYSAER